MKIHQKDVKQLKEVKGINIYNKILIIYKVATDNTLIQTIFNSMQFKHPHRNP